MNIFAILMSAGLLVFGALTGCAGFGAATTGGEVTPSAGQRAAADRVRQLVDGLVVWSSSRHGNHDLLIMRTDGTGVRRVTASDHVDWFPRFDPAGARILFTRSKQGWVSERDANRPEKWDLYTVRTDGSGLRLAARDASWGVFLGADRVLFSRGTRVFTRELSSGLETLLVDSVAVPALGGALLQNPDLSPNGRYLAITLRGSRRETGVLTLGSDRWVRTGGGCQVGWFPDGRRILWINPSGNGGSEALSLPMEEGRPARALTYEQQRFMDLPGRRSHEYFPRLDRAGRWMVWAATRRGHEHDTADYEVYIWRVGAPSGEAARLTFHSGNDRWPDIHVPGQGQGG